MKKSSVAGNSATHVSENGKVAENYRIQKNASANESSASLHIKGVSVHAAADQNLLPMTGSAVRVTQHSCLAVHCQQLMS